jgi:Spy/CpxP family protein refolding chaperone
MKTSLKTFITFIGLALAVAAPAVRAQSDAPAAAPETKKHEHSGGKHDRVQELADRLSLTDAQKTQVAAIYKDQEDALKALSADEKKTKSREITEAHRAQVRALLTPEQQTKFDAMTAKGGSEHKKKEKSE